MEYFTIKLSLYWGGIKGSGFTSKQDMVKSIPYWKVRTLRQEDGSEKVIAAILYKDNNGRKMVALCSDGSDEGKKECKRMLIDDITHMRSYGEISDAPLHIARKILGTEFNKYFIKASDAAKMLGKEVTPTGEYSYNRSLGGEFHEKYLYGKLGKGFKGK